MEAEQEKEERKEEKEHRRRKRLKERRVMERYERERWTLITRGFPVFLALDPVAHRPLRAVFVPRKGGLTKAQTRMKGILEAKGVDCRIEEE